MNLEHQNPTPRDRFHARWAVIAALLGALAGAGFQYLASRDVTDAKLLEMRGEIEKERGRADRLEAQLKELLGRAGAGPTPKGGPEHSAEEQHVAPSRGIVPSSIQGQNLPTDSEVTQTGSPTGGSVKPASWPSFETESYRLTVEDMKKSGKTVRITMMLEAIEEGGLSFRAGKWYLLDENGERWSEVERDPALVRHQRSGRDGGAVGAPPALLGVTLVSGTKIKDNLVFNATGSGQGSRFTLVGLESRPQSEREIILRDLVVKSD